MTKLSFDELEEFISSRSGKKALITFHSIGDRDAVSSAIALSSFFTTHIITTPDYITNNAKRMLEQAGYNGKIEHGIPENVLSNPSEWIIIVTDTNAKENLNNVGSVIENFKGEVLFIDHHLPEPELENKYYIFTDEGFNSTSSIVYKLLKLKKIQVSRELSILLLNGIISDSADFQNSTSETFCQVGELLQIADATYSEIMEYFHEKIPLENRYQLVKDLFGANIETVGTYMMIYGEAKMHANIAADTAIKIGADAALFWSITETEATISARLKAPLDQKLHIHLGKIMQELKAPLGGSGGGHPCAAGAYGPNKGNMESAIEIALGRIRAALLSSKGR